MKKIYFSYFVLLGLFFSTPLFASASVENVATISFFTTVVLVVIVPTFIRSLNKKRQYEVMTEYVRAGKDLPEDFLVEKSENVESTKKRRMRKNVYLLRSLICLAIGITLIAWGALDFDKDLLLIGVMITLIGVAFLIVNFVYNKEYKSESTDNN